MLGAADDAPLQVGVEVADLRLGVPALGDVVEEDEVSRRSGDRDDAGAGLNAEPRAVLAQEVDLVPGGDILTCQSAPHPVRDHGALVLRDEVQERHADHLVHGIACHPREGGVREEEPALVRHDDAVAGTLDDVTVLGLALAQRLFEELALRDVHDVAGDPNDLVALRDGPCHGAHPEPTAVGGAELQIQVVRGPGFHDVTERGGDHGAVLGQIEVDVVIDVVDVEARFDPVDAVDLIGPADLFGVHVVLPATEPADLLRLAQQSLRDRGLGLGRLSFRDVAGHGEHGRDALDVERSDAHLDRQPATLLGEVLRLEDGSSALVERRHDRRQPLGLLGDVDSPDVHRQQFLAGVAQQLAGAIVDVHEAAGARRRRSSCTYTASFMFWSSRRRRSSLACSASSAVRRSVTSATMAMKASGLPSSSVTGRTTTSPQATLAVLAHVALLAGVLVDLAGGEPPDLRDVCGDVVGVGDVGESALEQLVHGVAGHVREPRVDAPKAEVEPDEGGADGRLVEGEAEEPLALGERRLRLAQRGHVLDGGEGRDHRAIGIPDHRGGDEDGEALTVLAHEGEREGRGPALERPLEGRLDGFAFLGRPVGVRRPGPDQLVAAEAGHLAQCRIHVEVHAVGGEQREAVEHVLDQLAAERHAAAGRRRCGGLDRRSALSLFEPGGERF